MFLYILHFIDKIFKKNIENLNEKLKYYDKIEKELEEKYFRESLKRFGISSVVDTYSIKISRQLYIPIKDNFDKKFASSASDNIRAI